MCVKADLLPVFTLDGYDTKQIGCFVTPISRTIKQFGQMSEAHLQDYYSIIVCCNGQIDVQLDAVSIAIKPSMVLCVGPGSVMRLELSTQATGWMIQFSSDFFNFKSFENQLGSYSCFQKNSYCLQSLSTAEMEQWQFHLQQMQQEYQEKGTKSIVVLKAYLNILLETLQRKTVKPQLSKKRTEKDRKIEVFEQLVNEQFATLKLPSEYAAAMFVSVNYLNRICQETRNLSSGAIIRNRIVLEAERLLLHTGNTVSEIAAALGFDSLSYFVTFFKKHKGLSPEQFRKRNT